MKALSQVGTSLFLLAETAISEKERKRKLQIQQSTCYGSQDMIICIFILRVCVKDRQLYRVFIYSIVPGVFLPFFISHPELLGHTLKLGTWN